MNFYDRYAELCSEQNQMPQSKTMLDITQVTSAAISGWKNNGSLPKCDVICKIADYFNVTTDYLLGRTETRTPIITNLTAEEQLIINQYRNCSLDSQYVIKQSLQTFSSTSQSELSISKIG